MTPPVLRAAHAAQLRLRLLELDVRRRTGLGRTQRVLPYRGYGTPERVLVKARVLGGRPLPKRASATSLVGSVVDSYRRYATRQIPFARVEVRWGEATSLALADEEGFINHWMAPPSGELRSGWHCVQLDIPELGSGPVQAPVFIAGKTAEFGIISDLDDTVIVTGVTNPLKRAHALFLAHARTRLPFEGVNALYSALRNGSSGDANNPIFYVSSSPWNLYEHLEEFFELNDVPRGPLLLRDWGLSREGFAPGGGHGHKLERIREVLEAFPTLPFVLVGDSGQEDAEHYLTSVRHFPQRIRAVYIRNVSRREQRQRRLDEISREMERLGTRMCVVDDSVSAAKDAATRGWIRWEGVPAVVQEKQEDVEARTLVDKLDLDQ